VTVETTANTLITMKMLAFIEEAIVSRNYPQQKLKCFQIKECGLEEEGESQHDFNATINKLL
jgi:hypothetical protein